MGLRDQSPEYLQIYNNLEERKGVDNLQKFLIRGLGDKEVNLLFT